MDMLPKGDIAINKHDKEKKGDIAMTLGDAAVGSTVVSDLRSQVMALTNVVLWTWGSQKEVSFISEKLLL